MKKKLLILSFFKIVVDYKICSCYFNKEVRRDASVAQQVEHSPFKG